MYDTRKRLSPFCPCMLCLEHLLLVQALDPHPQEHNGDQSDDEDHEEGDGDPDECGDGERRGGEDGELQREQVAGRHHVQAGHVRVHRRQNDLEREKIHD